MVKLPQKNTLVHQAAAFLRERIAQGAWEEWLPGERMLEQMLQVSRGTVRAALVQLRKDGIIATEESVGNRIVRHGGRKKGGSIDSDAGLLVCGELYRFQHLPMGIFWIDHLRAMLAERGSRLHVHDGRIYARRNPGPALKKLMRTHPHRCWILLKSSEGAQAWFQKNAVPCILVGTPHAGIDLPYCDIDYRAVCRHATGLLLRRGHRRIALLIKHSRLAGDIQSEAGFSEAFARLDRADAPPVICHHDGTPEGVAAAVRRLMAQKQPPTALLVAYPHHYLTVASCLGKLGFDVPRDVSLILRDYEPCLDWLLPRVSCYAFNVRAQARKLLDAITPALNGGPPPGRTHIIMPEFSEGGSIAPPPPPACV